MPGQRALLGFFALAAFVLAITISEGEALKCYECSSAKNRNGTACADPFDKEAAKQFLMPCKDMGKNREKKAFCRKQYQKIGDETRITRSCGYEWNEKKDEGECLSNNSENVRQQSCQCKIKDGCNSAGISVASVLALLLPAVLLVQ